MPNFELKGKVSLDGSQWKAGLAQAERETKGFAQNVSISIGSFIKGHIISAIKDAFYEAVRFVASQLPRSAKIRDQAMKAGVTPERYQQFEYAATQNGATGEQVVAAIKGLSKTQQRANELDDKGKFKDRGIRETFAKFGVTDQDLQMSPAALFQVIGKRVGEGWNKKDAMADLQKLMEESGVALIPMFKAGFEEAMQKAAELGLTSGADVRLLAGLDDKKTDLLFKANNIAATKAAAGARLIQNTKANNAAFISAGPGAPPPIFFEMQRTMKNIERNTDTLK